LLQGDVNVDTYGQFVLKNHSQTANASADFVAVANNGDDTGYYIDMGMNSNVYANVDYAVTGANDGYLYVNGGNLVIGTQTGAKVIKFFTDGTDNVSNVRLTISSSGITTPGNITGNYVIANTAAIGGIVSATGNVIGGNLNIPAGLISAAGNITGLNVNTTILSATGNIRGGNINTAGVVSATANIVGGNLTTGAQVVATGNITGGNIITNGAVSAVGAISATGNVTGGNVNTGGNVTVSGLISAVGNIVTSANIVTANTVINSRISTSGNIIGANISTGGLITATGNITGGNVNTGGLITATGNIGSTANVSASYFIGNGAVLTGLNAYGNVYANGTAVLATTGSSSLTLTPGNNQVITGNNSTKAVTIAVSDNPTFANVSATGNITAANFNGNIVSTGNISTTANVIAGYGIFSAGNTVINAGISTTGNVTGNYFLGNGSQLTGTVGGSRYYGQFWDTTTQNNGGATTANPMTFNTSDAFNTGVSITVGNTSHVVIANPGVYNLQFSAQFAKTDSGQDTVSVWLAKDGVNVPDSCSDLDLNNNNARSIAAWNWLVNPTVANTYYQIYWSSSDTNMSIFAEGTRINPTRPAIPSVILTVTQA
jgi:filamentous hemagglutinin